VFLSNNKRAEHNSNVRHANATSTSDKDAVYRSVWRFWPTYVPIALKLSLSIGVMLSLIMFLLGAIIIHNQTELLNHQILSSGRIVVKQMAESAKEPILANDILQLDVLTNNLTSSDDIIGTSVYSTEGKILSSAGPQPFEPYAPLAGHSSTYLKRAPITVPWTWSDSAYGDLDAISYVTPISYKNITAGYVLTTFSRKTMTASIRDSIHSIVLATLFLIPLGIVLSYFIARNFARPLQDLMDASRAINQGEYRYRLHEKRNDEIGYLMSAFNNMAHGMLQKKQVEEAFAKHVPAGVVKNILENLDGVKLGGTHTHASVMFIDIEGFTSKSETLSPTEVGELLNEFFTYISDTVPLYKGTIDKYMGDCAMLVFGVPEPDEDHIFHAISYAVFFQKLLVKINNLRLSRGKFPIKFRIGLNTGEVLAGNMGSVDRVQFTVVGDTVNLASRLSSLSNPEQVLITEETYNIPLVRKRIVATRFDTIHVRGKATPVSLYQVHDVVEPYLTDMDQEIRRFILKTQQKQ